MADAKESLTSRQQAFVEQFLIDNNATQAAIRAGYSVDTAQEQSSRLLANAIVGGAVAKAQAQRLARVNVSADAVITELSILANSCVEHYVLDDFGQVRPAENAPDGVMRAVKSIKRKVRHDKDGSITYDVSFELWDKPGQLKLMGRHAGAKACFDRVEVSGPNGGPISIVEVRSVIVDPKRIDAAVIEGETA